MTRSQSPPTEVRIARAASDLFLTRGYRGTTLHVIASEADVAVQTIYNRVGSKAQVLSLALDYAVSGTEFPRPVPDFMRERAAAAPDATTVVAVLADWFAEVNARSADVFHLIREAAAVDPEVADLERRRERRRFENYGLAADALATRGHANLDREQAAALIWALGHPNVYRHLVIDGTWTVPRYKEWIAASLDSALAGFR